MDGLLLPPKVQAEIDKEKYKAERERRRALAERLLDFDDPVSREWQPTLTLIDPHLRLGRARGQAYEPGMNVRPGFYHWYRDNPTAAPTIEPITGPDGESFAEPDSRLLEQLRGNDLHHPAVWRAHIQKRADTEAAREKQLEEEKQRRITGTLERYKAGNNASVLVSDDVAWSQNVAGRKGRKK